MAALIVDVTGNGGGSEWVDPVTRIFSALPLRAMRAATVRHPRSVAPTEARLAAVQVALGDPRVPAPSRPLLEEARDRLAREQPRPHESLEQVAARSLAELRALCELARVLHTARPLDEHKMQRRQ